MVLLPLRRVASRLLGLALFSLAIAAALLFLGQMRHAYDQHQKYQRLVGYKHYVDDVSNYLERVEVTANRSNLSIQRLNSLLDQRVLSASSLGGRSPVRNGTS